MRVSEIYKSVQGEGPNVGLPTVFLRFGGCNLRCPGWPCDTQHAIDPKYRNEWEKLTPPDVAKRVEVVADSGAYNVCLTGGEPFLQNIEEMNRLTELLEVMEYDIECFSNGALPYPDWAPERIHFVMDWKLPGSGEETFVEVRQKNFELLCNAVLEKPHSQSIKFTIKNEHDYEVAKGIYYQYLEGTDFNIFYGIVWNEITNSQVVEWVLKDKLDWRLNVQVHNHIWDRRRRGI